MQTTELAALADAKWTFSTRRVDRACVAGTDRDFTAARAGDLILAQVDSLGQHARVQLASGRPSIIYPGDLIVLACGARYAPDQFEGLAEIDPEGTDLLAGGGCIGRMVARNERIKPATRLFRTLSREMLKCRAASRWLMPSAQARRTFRYMSTVMILQPSLQPAGRTKVDDFYAVRSGPTPPLPWTNFAPPFSVVPDNGSFDPYAGTRPARLPAEEPGRELRFHDAGCCDSL